MNKEKEYYEFGLKSAYLKEIEPWLNEYFGINYGYFIDEIRRMNGYSSIKAEIGESEILKALDLDEDIPFIASFKIDDFPKLFAPIMEDDDSDHEIMTVMLLLANIIKDKNFDWIYDIQDVTDYMEYDIVREDLLKLYIFTNQRKLDTLQGQKLSLKHQLGSVEIANYANWFTHKFLKDYLAIYLSDIDSIEQAENELLKYKKRAGRKIRDNRIHILLYGIFRMFNDHKKMKSPQSDSLCEFIQSYLRFVELTDEDTIIDNQWIRAQITYIKTKPQPPKFENMGIPIRVTLEDLKNTGKRLF